MRFNTIVYVALSVCCLHLRMSMTDKTERTQRKSANARVRHPYELWLRCFSPFFCLYAIWEWKNKHTTHNNNKLSWLLEELVVLVLGLSPEDVKIKYSVLVFAFSAGSNDWKNDEIKFRILFVIYLARSAIVRWSAARLAIYRVVVYLRCVVHRWRWPMTILFAERKQMCISIVLFIFVFFLLLLCPARWCRGIWTATGI